jgi:hypothetical protein
MKGEDLKQRSRARVFIAPLGSARSGRLVFTTSAAGVTLLSKPTLQGLVRGHFVRRVSWVGFEAGIVMVGYYPDSYRRLDVLGPSSDRPPSPPLNRGSGSDKPGDEITLNTSIPWEIEFRGDISNLNADLRGLELRSLDVLGVASQIRLLLSEPAKTTFIYITAGILDSTIRLPPGVGVRVQVSGGISNLTFDGQSFTAIKGDINLENSNFKSETSRCDVCIAGGASNLTIEEQVYGYINKLRPRRKYE